MGKRDFEMAQKESRIIWRAYDYDDWFLKTKTLDVFSPDKIKIGTFQMGEHKDFSLYYTPVGLDRRIKIWNYRDYGTIHAIKQSMDGKRLFFYYNYGLIFWHYRVAIIDAMTGKVVFRRISQYDYLIFSGTKPQLARQKEYDTQSDRPQSSAGAAEFGLMQVAGDATEFLLEDSSGQKTGYTSEGLTPRMIPASRWKADAPKPESGGPYQRITLDPPTPGTYRFTMDSAQNRFDFLAYVTFKSGKKGLSVSCVGYAKPGAVQTYDLQLTEAGDNLALSVPIEDLRTNKRRAGFYFEIENPPSREVVVEDPQGRRFGRNAINLQSYWDLQGVTLAATDNGQTNQQRVWGLVWAAQPGTYKVFVSQYSNTNQNAPRDPRSYKMLITRWPARGPLAAVQTMEGSISWGEGQTVNVEVER